MITNLQSLLTPFGINAPAIDIDELVLDSRLVSIHKVFVAVVGHMLDGRDFIPQAISLGAKVILAQTDESQRHGEVTMREHSLIIHFYQLDQKLSELAGHFYRHPADSMKMLAVTGTNGKTSTTQLAAQIWQATGAVAGTIGTLGAGLMGQLETTQNTTPDAISMQKLLHQLSADGAAMVALEASSHALVQQRIAALKIDVAVFTNISRDHLDYHGSMAEYAAAKRRLLAQHGLAYVVLNQHDAESMQWLENRPVAVRPVFFGFDKALYPRYEYCIATKVDYHANGCHIHVQSTWGDCILDSPLMGHFNVLNLLAAVSSQLCLGVNIDSIAEVATQLHAVTGRMEIFRNSHANVVVDYAHTPDGLMQALTALREHCHGKLWCMFGCGGDRDVGKRAIMGEIAERFADRVIVTNDNSRSEDPQLIVEHILAGCTEPQSVQVELDRKRAIQLAIAQASPQDIILLAGKGHEDYQIINNTRLQYDERDYVKQLLKGMEQ
ncbi:UDP-N-acetylmuramoyl-L-alanyl-D-glutamate--2,6-diaminopimelate ligase [Alteromonadaceae bacterium BrNp21-10]|nr:UDP-N-acetylmuramoyl-L-alanyl-D-glutamate--2,6-diaminopimelate ligase [Alteromonadaceae bacterium BrNp21-10]